MKKLIVFYIFFSLIIIANVHAHPGRTDSKGCHKCNGDNTDCSKWGLEDYEYHCHSGNTYTNSKGKTYNSSGKEINITNDTLKEEENKIVENPTNEEDVKNNFNNENNTDEEIIKEEKSSDNSVKSIVIDEKIYTDIENIYHSTYKEKVIIEVNTNDDKASYEINNLDLLEIGKNKINIIVCAEDGTTKTYEIIVNREENLSSDVGIEVTINGEILEFINYEAVYNVSSSINELDIEYILSDKNALVEFDDEGELKYGENILKFLVTAEDGTTQEYKITVNKESNNNIFVKTIGLTVLGGTSYGIYRIIKGKKKR